MPVDEPTASGKWCLVAIKPPEQPFLTFPFFACFGRVSSCGYDGTAGTMFDCQVGPFPGLMRCCAD